MVTLISQDLSEFALHVRAFLGLPVGGIRQYGPAASAVILPQLTSQNVTFDNVQNAVGADLQIRLFGKPEIDGSRRLGVALATAESVVDAIKRAKHAAGQVKDHARQQQHDPLRLLRNQIIQNDARRNEPHKGQGGKGHDLQLHAPA